MLKNKRGQSAVEFALILPVIVFSILGTVQLFVIMTNFMMLQYAAYMTARSASMYDAYEAGKEAGKTFGVTKSMVMAAANYSSDCIDTTFSAGKNVLVNKVLLGSEDMEIEDKRISCTERNYRTVKVIYLMPLKVPVVNRLFGLFSKEPELKVSAAMSYPVIKLSASGFVRVE